LEQNNQKVCPSEKKQKSKKKPYRSQGPCQGGKNEPESVSSTAMHAAQSVGEGRVEGGQIEPSEAINKRGDGTCARGRIDMKLKQTKGLERL